MRWNAVSGRVPGARIVPNMVAPHASGPSGGRAERERAE